MTAQNDFRKIIATTVIFLRIFLSTLVLQLEKFENGLTSNKFILLETNWIKLMS